MPETTRNARCSLRQPTSNRRCTEPEGHRSGCNFSGLSAPREASHNAAKVIVKALAIYPTEPTTAELALILYYQLAKPLTDERDVWRKALNDLTSGGSEFYDDPRRCAENVQERQSTLFRMLRDKVKRVNLLEKAVNELYGYAKSWAMYCKNEHQNSAPNILLQDLMAGLRGEKKNLGCFIEKGQDRHDTTCRWGTRHCIVHHDAPKPVEPEPKEEKLVQCRECEGRGQVPTEYYGL